MPKIYLVITPFFPTTESFRGPYVYDQVKAIEREGRYKVIVLKPQPFYSKAIDYEYEGVKVFYFKTYDLPSGMLPGLFNKLSLWSLKRTLRKIGVELSEISVVHSHVTFLGIYANQIKRQVPTVKSILQHHGLDVLSLNNGILSRFKWHRNWVANLGVKICNQIDLHVGVSRKTLEFLSAIPGINIKDQYVLYNGVDTEKFYPIKGRKDPSFFTIGCIANFWVLKDQITLIKATERLIKEGINNLRVVFIGSGATLSTCKKYIKQQNLSEYFAFKKEVYHHELIYFYNSLDLFVLTSYWEAFGCVYSESYACGVPFIAVKDQGIAELLSSGDSARWLIEKKDYQQLALLIKQQRSERNCQKLKKSICIDELILSYLEYLDDVV